MPPLYQAENLKHFEDKIDSLREIRLQLYLEYDTNHHLSKGFKAIALANINYDYYSKKGIIYIGKCH